MAAAAGLISKRVGHIIWPPTCPRAKRRESADLEVTYQDKEIPPMKWNNKVARAYLIIVAVASLVVSVLAGSKWD
jgi:hypothetical protein